MPLHDEDSRLNVPNSIHPDCIEQYTTRYLPGLVQSLLDSTHCPPLNACGLSRIYALLSLARECFARKARGAGLTARDLEVAVEALWPEFERVIHDQELLQIARDQAQGGIPKA